MALKAMPGIRVNKQKKPMITVGFFEYWWPRAESNHRHKDFQSSALPTELLGLLKKRLSCNSRFRYRFLTGEIVA